MALAANALEATCIERGWSVERQTPQPRQIQHRPGDLVTSLLGSGGQPVTQSSGGATLDHVQELSGAHIDDRGRPRLGAPPALAGKHDLVHAEGVDLTDTIVVSVNQRGAVGHHSVVDRMPVGTDKQGAAIRGSLGVHEPCRHDGLRHHNRCLRHRNVTGRPKHARSHQFHHRTVLHPHPLTTSSDRPACQ